MTETTQKQILTHPQVEQKIRRIAFEIYEQNFEEQEIILAGIFDRGYLIGQELAKILTEISPVKVTLMRIDVDKIAPHQHQVLLDMPKGALQDKVVIVIDDVLNTARTLAYSLSPFFGVSLKKLQVAVLVSRNHRRYPVSADYIGISLATTLSEHIAVAYENQEWCVCLK
jgi:pyrimidine operon attenuation protein / uracil phosphoribosyltransferase